MLPESNDGHALPVVLNVERRAPHVATRSGAPLGNVVIAILADGKKHRPAGGAQQFSLLLINQRLLLACVDAARATPVELDVVHAPFRPLLGVFLLMAVAAGIARTACRSEERRVGKECRSRWS